MEYKKSRNIIVGAWLGTWIIGGSILYLVSQTPSKSKQISPLENRQEEHYGGRTLTRDEKVATTPWSIMTNKNSLAQLITPHRNDYYGTNGPVYVHGEGDVAGETALDLAKWVIEYKNEFSKMAGDNGEFPSYCRVDDLNEDGHADRISWPRLERMPVFERPFTKDMNDMADKVVAYDNYIVDYIRRQ